MVEFLICTFVVCVAPLLWALVELCTEQSGGTISAELVARLRPIGADRVPPARRPAARLRRPAAESLARSWDPACGCPVCLEDGSVLADFVSGAIRCLVRTCPTAEDAPGPPGPAP
ncbi:MAG TPA: hypothetical protein VFF52_26890 [Isosphaeraceae bacterium]|nr:hypothetical protein [Isosphaeraceae bacterium]